MVLKQKLTAAGVGCHLSVLALSPWFFGAWEIWWFWLFTVVLFAGSVCFLLARIPAGGHGLTEPDATPALPGRQRGLPWTPVPFLVYALIRTAATPVYLDAERSFLLFFTPWLLGIHLIYDWPPARRRQLLFILMLNFALLGAYGIMNHVIGGNRYVLWQPGFPQYQEGTARATGSVFCPNHYAGMMELAAALSLGLLISREPGWRAKAGAAGVLLIALAGVGLSKSRGGAMTLAVMFAAVVIWGFGQYSPLKRWCNRVSLAALAAMALLLLLHKADGFTERFEEYLQSGQHVAADEQVRATDRFATRLMGSARGIMISGALRAWRTQPAVGIGAGMHRHYWPRFAASPDGDRELDRWPRRLNNTHFSFEVHSDWVQLLEEYGVVGFLLFTFAACWVFVCYLRLLAGINTACRRANWNPSGQDHHAVVLGGLLVFVAMAFHSLGDFNLQIPAIAWLFGALLALPIGLVRQAPGRYVRRRRKPRFGAHRLPVPG